MSSDFDINISPIIGINMWIVQNYFASNSNYIYSNNDKSSDMANCNGISV